MRRREFITLLGGVAASWPLAARAQQAGKLPTIGFLGTTTPSAQNQWTAAFVQRLRELGWIEGRTVAIEYRWGEGRNERFADIAAEFVRLKVDVIVTGEPQSSQQSKRHRSSRSFSPWRRPARQRLRRRALRDRAAISPACRPGPDLAGKRSNSCAEVLPGFRRLAILANVGNPNTLLEMGEIEGYGPPPRL
jgi:putative ABC transport system substrate-binding protein